jgi:serine/threonine protein kinase
MAETWRARWVGSAGVAKQVAIKRILPGFTEDPQFIAMFVSEAKLVATLSHGNIAQVFDVGQVDGEYYIAMEYVDGPSIKGILEKAKEKKQPRVPLPLALYLTTELCKALHSAHTARDEAGTPLSIVHRDISPENIMVSWQGQLKVIDFGIARSAMAERPRTEAGIMKGKVMYMSPEQARATDVDALTDVWAAGVVLFEMLCGEAPVPGASYDGLMAMWRGEGRRAAQVNPQVPAEVDSIIAKAMAVSRTDRLRSAQHLHDALADILHRDWPGVSQAWVSAYLTELYADYLKQENRVVDVPVSARAALRSAMAGKSDTKRQRTTSKQEIPQTPLDEAAPPTLAGPRPVAATIDDAPTPAPGRMPVLTKPPRTSSGAANRMAASFDDEAQDETAVDVPLVVPHPRPSAHRAVTEVELDTGEAIAAQHRKEIDTGEATARKRTPHTEPAVDTAERSDETNAVALMREEVATDGHGSEVTNAGVDLARLTQAPARRAGTREQRAEEALVGLTASQRALLVKLALALGGLLLMAITFALFAFKEE